MFALSIGSITPAIAAAEVPDATSTLVPAQIDPGLNTAQQSHSVPSDALSGRGTWLFPPIGKYLNRQTG